MYHIYLAHLLWKDFLRPGMTVIDATAGNGNDTLVLAKAVLTPNSGWVHAFDVQKEALQNTKLRLQKELHEPLQRRITLHEASHEHFPGDLTPHLIVYNLGYLPGGDTSKTTQAETSLSSCQKGLDLLAPQGMLSITLYPGHPEGLREKGLLLDWFSTLPHCSLFHHTPLVGRNKPSLIILRKQQQKNYF